jgi:hypothetical protein
MQVWNPSASFTRPNDTTAYAAGDLVANATAAGAVVPLQIPLGNQFPNGMTRLTRARLVKSGTGVVNASFRVHLYETAPTPANGDNAAWSTDQASMLAFTDGAAGTGSAPAGSEMFLRLAGKTVYALLAALGAYAPAANETFTLTLEDVSDY